jgi:SAM-dependent methyltransferase
MPPAVADDVDSDVEKEQSIAAVLDLGAVNEQNDIYDEVIRPFPITLGKSVSKKEREETGNKAPTLVYGEITFQALGVALEKIKKVYGKPDVGDSGATGFMQEGQRGVFYDLGCGTGKPVVAAAIAHTFDVCYGIEILEGLYSVALDVLNAYNTRGKAKLNRSMDTHVQMMLGSFLNFSVKDWRDADVLYINSTCFDENIMMGLAKLARGLKKGAFVITLTKQLPSDEFAVLEYEMQKMSWGDATLFILQKTTDPKRDESDDEEDQGDNSEEEDDDDDNSL